MATSPNFTSAREIQRNYKRLFEQVKKTKRPLVVMRNNKPEVAIIGIKKLEEYEALSFIVKSLREIKEEKAKTLTGSLVDLWHETQKGKN